MERETKFRGRRTDNREWVYGNLVRYPSRKGEWTKSSEIWNFDSKGEHYWVVIPETVGQFTGLKDKYGVEIYEGDIIRFCDDPPYCSDYIVKYDDERLIWIASGAVGDYMEDLWELGCGDFVRVIGNIHDDSEML
jgi:uncharacterized phage protein (TIGR01671 family)